MQNKLSLLFLILFALAASPVFGKILLGQKHLGVQSAHTERGEILFVSDQIGEKDIFVVDLETKKITNLTNTRGDDMNPQLAPDGKTIVFYSNRSGRNQIYTMNLITRQTTQLTRDMADDYDPSYSPDGKYIVFKSTRDDSLGDIFIMDSDGTNQKNLTAGRKTTEEWDPAFTNDGRTIVFVIRTNGDAKTDELYRMNTDGSGITRLTSNGIPDWYPSVNPTTGQILFVSQDPATNTDAIFLINPDGTGRKQISHLPGSSDDPSWSDDGKEIVFIHKKTDDAMYDIYLMNNIGGDVREVVKTDSDKLSPIFLQKR